MDLILLVLVLCLVGFIVWLLTTRIPMPPGWANAIQTIAFVLLILYLIVRLAPALPHVLR